MIESGNYRTSAGDDLLRWVLFIVLGIALVILFTHLVQICFSSMSASGKSTEPLSNVMCLGIDFFVYLLLGVWVNPQEVPIWKIMLYIFSFELITQGLLSSIMPQYFNASPWKSLVDVMICAVGFTIGMAIQVRSCKRAVEMNDYALAWKKHYSLSSCVSSPLCSSC